MNVPPPKHCRPEAYQLLAEQLDRLDEPDALWKGAVAIARHEKADADVELTGERLDHLAGIIRGRVQSRQLSALLAHGHAVLFEEQGFRGNTDDYYDTANSYLPDVLETCRGIPISLTLIYKCVMERIGVTVAGVNAPGHFLADVSTDGEHMYVDPFAGGRVLHREEVFTHIEKMLKAQVPRSDSVLAHASHREWLARTIRNLQGIFQARGRTTDLAAMTEMQNLLSYHVGS